VVSVALRRMNDELHSNRSGEVLEDVLREVANGHNGHDEEIRPESSMAR
jgi:hypothetical protein